MQLKVSRERCKSKNREMEIGVEKGRKKGRRNEKEKRVMG